MKRLWSSSVPQSDDGVENLGWFGPRWFAVLAKFKGVFVKFVLIALGVELAGAVIFHARIP